MAQSETPLDGKTRCPAGHLCSSADAYCSRCGAAVDGGGELDIDEPSDLVAKWRREADAADTNDVASARRNCAFELAQLLGVAESKEVGQ